MQIICVSILFEPTNVYISRSIYVSQGLAHVTWRIPGPKLPHINPFLPDIETPSSPPFSLFSTTTEHCAIGYSLLMMLDADMLSLNEESI